MSRVQCCEAFWDSRRLTACPRCDTPLRTTEDREHPRILEIDQAAQMQLETRRQLSTPDKPGWWRNAPNLHAVGHQPNDNEL